MGLIFNYIAKDANGEYKKGEIEAANPEDAVNELQAQGLTIVDIEEGRDTESSAYGMKKCPYCGEEIKEEAIKCKHCHEFLPEMRKDKKGDIPTGQTIFITVAIVVGFIIFYWNFIGPLFQPSGGKYKKTSTIITNAVCEILRNPEPISADPVAIIIDRNSAESVFRALEIGGTTAMSEKILKLYIEGKTFHVSPNTKCKVLEKYSSYSKIEILDGIHRSRIGYAINGLIY